MTALIHERLAALTPHVEGNDLEMAIRDLSAIYADELMAELPASEELSRRLRADQEIIRGVEHFSQTEPELVQTFARKLRAHRLKGRRLGLGLDSLSSRRATLLPLRVLLALMLSPLALYGFVHKCAAVLRSTPSRASISTETGNDRLY